LLQEHWLTPSNLNNSEHRFGDYFPFDSSAMSSCLESGMLRGRPLGRVITLVSKTLRNYTSTIHYDERFNIAKIFDRLLITFICHVLAQITDYYYALIYWPTFGLGESFIVIVSVSSLVILIL